MDERVEKYFREWSAYQKHPEDIKQELIEIADDEEAIYDRFYRELEFGTGGLRGVLGAGRNRMNVYTVRRATRGLAQFILSLGSQAAKQGVAIGYDCRRMSREFSLEAALVLAAAGVRAYLFEHLCPTPELSYAVRHLGASGGIMITASHNPPEYNGYKVYGADGGQMLPDVAQQVMNEIDSITNLFDIPVMDREEALQNGMLTYLGDAMDESYYQAVIREVASPSLSTEDRQKLAIVYTPLHGTGNVPVREVLKRVGYEQVYVVPSQEHPDGEFSTVKSPNPEEPAALELGISQAQESGAAIVMGTDPDADRVGVAVRDKDGSFRLLTGNQVGGLLIDYLLRDLSRQKALPANGIVFKTIVTSSLGAKVAQEYGIPAEDTLTGFKYIGERIGHYESTREKTFLFGYEESYGYLASPIVRDKDAVQACLMIADMAASWQLEGKSLLDALLEIYQRVGYHEERLISVTMPGADGLARMQRTMQMLRNEGVPDVSLQISAIEDYATLVRKVYAKQHFPKGQTATADPQEVVQTEAILLPHADVLKYVFDNGSWLAIRPSGTEPKIKIYVGATGTTAADCQSACDELEGWMRVKLS